jgi:hypothetical protein
MRTIKEINHGGVGIVEEVGYWGDKFARKTFVTNIDLMTLINHSGVLFEEDTILLVICSMGIRK